MISWLLLPAIVVFLFFCLDLYLYYLAHETRQAVRSWPLHRFRIKHAYILLRIHSQKYLHLFMQNCSANYNSLCVLVHFLGQRVKGSSDYQTIGPPRARGVMKITQCSLHQPLRERLATESKRHDSLKIPKGLIADIQEMSEEYCH